MKSCQKWYVRVKFWVYSWAEALSFIRVITQKKKKKKLSNNFFKISLKVPYQSLWRKNTIKKIGHRACLKDVVGQTYPIYACTGANHARAFISSTVHF